MHTLLHSLARPMAAFSSALLFLALAAPMYGQGALELKSQAFAAGTTIPQLYSCDGQDQSPPLSWTGVPKSAKSLALIVDDPDAPVGTFVHWVVYGLPPRLTQLDVGVKPAPTIPVGGLQGRNGRNRYGYAGPCPPPGTPHHYHFRLFVLDSSLDLQSGATAAELSEAMKGHRVASTELIGTFGR